MPTKRSQRNTFEGGKRDPAVRYGRCNAVFSFRFFSGKVKPSSSPGFREGYAPVIECPVKCLFSSSRSFRGDNFGGLGKVLLLVGKLNPRITGAGGENSMLLDAARSDVEGGGGATTPVEKEEDWKKISLFSPGWKSGKKGD